MMNTTFRMIDIMRALLLLTCGIMSFALPANATIGVTAIGSWSLPITANDLLGLGGCGLPTMYESTNNQVALTVCGTSGNSESWRIDIHRSDSIWDNRLTFSVKRTGGGLGSGSIVSGTTYQPIEATNTAFFFGTGDRANITLQFQLGGMSVLVPANTYGTEISYTVVDL